MNTVDWQRGASDCPGAAAPQAWATTSPDAAGLDAAALESLARSIDSGELANIHSLVIVKDGALAYEHYWAGDDAKWAQSIGRVTFTADTLHDLRSVTKSVVGALVGIAHGEGALPDLDAPLASFFPEHAQGREQDLAGRTLRHALTMSAGLSWDELSHPYWDPRNDENGLWRASDPLEYALSRKPVAPGGTAFKYNGGLPVVLGQVVEKATGTPLDAYAREKLWCPLGVTHAEWVRHPSGIFVAASGLRLTPRDMARFGQMMLDEGRFAGKQIVPADFARESLASQVSTNGGFTPGYGYLWWIAQLPLAIGNGGQRIAVDKAHRMVVVITAGNYDSPTQGEGPTRVLTEVFRALR